MAVHVFYCSYVFPFFFYFFSMARSRKCRQVKNVGVWDTSTLLPPPRGVSKYTSWNAGVRSSVRSYARCIFKKDDSYVLMFCAFWNKFVAVTPNKCSCFYFLVWFLNPSFSPFCAQHAPNVSGFSGQPCVSSGETFRKYWRNLKNF